MSKSEYKINSEKIRPKIHFTPPRNWMNDPNGLVYYKGEYHLFYQYNPKEANWGNIHWGHAVSNDLIHWKHLDIALKPDEHGLMFSGSAVIDKNDTTGFFNGKEGMVAIYTSALPQQDNDFFLQKQCIAFSKDKGRTWHKYKGNPVIENQKWRDFRDPKVFWHKKTDSWIMIVTNGKKVNFYRSNNLKKWEFTSDYSCNAFDFQGSWECPDLLKLPVQNEKTDKWLLQVGIQDNSRAGGSGCQYFVGEFNGYEFKNDNPDHKTFWVDHGQDFYAVQSWSNLPKEQKRNVWIGWMSNLAYSGAVPTDKWRGVQSIPRSLMITKYNNEYYLKQKPVKEFNNLRENIKTVKNYNKDSSYLLYIEEDPSEISFEAELKENEILNISLQRKDELKIEIIYNRKDKEVKVKRSFNIDKKIDKEFNDTHYANIIKDHKKIDIQIIQDRSTIEIFINNGEIVFSELIFPEDDLKSKFQINTDQDNLEISNLKINKLSNIWE